jgi:hypothetical protein
MLSKGHFCIEYSLTSKRKVTDVYDVVSEKDIVVNENVSGDSNVGISTSHHPLLICHK